MTIAFRARTAASGTTTVAPGLPAGTGTGDAVLIFVNTKPDTATVVVPTGWTLVSDVAGGGGTTGAGVGPSRQAVLLREKDASWSAMPTVSITSGNSSIANAVAFTKDAAATWAIAAATGTWGSAAATTNATTTLGSNPGITAGDAALVGYSSMQASITWSAQSVSATGISAWGAVSNAVDGGSATGNDISYAFFWAPVTTGTATAAAVTAATLSSAGRGTVSLIRLRETVAGANLTGTPADQVDVTDAPATVLDGTRSPADPVGVTDAAGTVQTGTRTQPDPVGVTDAATTALATTRALTDPEAITDSTTTTLAAARTQPDAVGITDSVATVLTSGATLTQPDAIGLTDAVTAQLDRVVTVDDLLDLIDAPAPTIIRPRPSDDTIETSDAITVTLERVVDVADTVDILDVVTPGDGGPPPPPRRVLSAVLIIPTLAADLEVPGSIAATLTAAGTVRADLTIPEARGVLT